MISKINEEIDSVCENSKLRKLMFQSGMNWMGVLISYLRDSSYKLDPKLVICMNDLEDAISDGRDAIEIFLAYDSLITTANSIGIDIINMPFKFFGRRFH